MTITEGVGIRRHRLDWLAALSAAVAASAALSPAGGVLASHDVQRRARRIEWPLGGAAAELRLRGRARLPERTGGRERAGRHNEKEKSEVPEARVVPVLEADRLREPVDVDQHVAARRDAANSAIP